MNRLDYNNGPDADERPLVEVTQGRYVRYAEHVEKMNEALELAARYVEASATRYISDTAKAVRALKENV